MDKEEMERRVEETLTRQQAIRDSIPEGPGLVLSEREAHVVSILISLFVEASNEDLPGVILYHTGAHLLGDEELVGLSQKIRDVLARTNHVPRRSL